MTKTKLPIHILLMVVLCMVMLLTGCEKDDAFSRATWQIIDLGYTGELSDIALLSEDTIMILSRMDDSYQRTCIFESDDAGETWEKRCFDKLDAGGFYNLYCFNSKKICATGGALFQSDDGGYSWHKLADSGGLLYFFDDNNGFLSSGYSIYKTTNGGHSFETVYAYGGFRFVQFFDRQIGYAAGGTGFDSYLSGHIVKTTDGGNTWYSLQKFKKIIGMSFISADIGYILIDLHEGEIFETYKEGAELLKTTDGGDTWTSINNKIYDDFYIMPFQCYFTDEQHGFLCGSGKESKILSSSDGGKTWREEYAGISSGYLLSKIMFTSSGTGYAVGNNGLLLKRTDH